MKRWKSTPGAAATLPITPVGVQTSEATVSAFLADLAVLRGVPLSFLVPYPEMLPPESLLFFYVDPNWMQALLQGALSLGAMGTVPPPATTAAFGFLLNSSLFQAYPTMIVSAFAVDGTTPEPLRLEPLTSTLLIALYDRPLATITLTQPHEGFELGFELDDFDANGLPVFAQQMRYFATGTIGAGAAGINAPIALKPGSSAQFQAVDLAGTLDSFNAVVAPASGSAPSGFDGSLLDASTFPLELVQQASAVTFTIQLPPAPPS